MRQDGLTDANPHITNENFGEDVDDFDEELAATMIVQSPGGFRNLVRSDVRLEFSIFNFSINMKFTIFILEILEFKNKIGPNNGG